MKLANNGNDLGGILLGKVARCFEYWRKVGGQTEQGNKGALRNQ